jgi:hypothetical protein
MIFQAKPVWRQHFLHKSCWRVTTLLKSRKYQIKLLM